MYEKRTVIDSVNNLILPFYVKEQDFDLCNSQDFSQDQDQIQMTSRKRRKASVAEKAILV